jgi:hypothetical protein
MIATLNETACDVCLSSVNISSLWVYLRKGSDFYYYNLLIFKRLNSIRIPAKRE